MSYTPKALGDVVYIAADDYTPPDLAIITVIPSATVSGISLIGWHQSVVGDASIRNAYAFINLDSLYQPARLASLVVLSGEDYAPAPLLATYAVPSIAIAAPIFSIPRVELVSRTVNGLGFDGAAIGNPSLAIYQSFIRANGFDVSAFGLAQAVNYFKTIYASGFVDSFAPAPYIENRTKYLHTQGLIASSVGDHFVSGGVKWLTLAGFNANSFASPTVVNTTANQIIALAGNGIAPSDPPSPVLSPRTIYAVGIKSDKYGESLVRCNPNLNPDGFDVARYGYPRISLNPQYIEPSGADSFTAGDLKIYDPTQYLNLTGHAISGGIFGDTAAKNDRRLILPAGFDAGEFSGFSTVYTNKQPLDAVGFDGHAFGAGEIANNSPSIVPDGFDELRIGEPKTYNLRKYVAVIGFNSLQVATNPYLSGGVNIISLIGLDALGFTAPIVVNTTADQAITLNGEGIAPLLIPSPVLSPRIIYPVGIKGDKHGQPLVQRNPSPHGFDAARYGEPRVLHNPIQLTLAGIDGFSTGYLRIYDPTQTVYLADKGIGGGIFGDAAATTNRRIVRPAGVDASGFSVFSAIYSNRRTVTAIGFNGQVFGANDAANKTPALIPTGFDSVSGLDPSIAYRIRTIYQSGLYALGVGSPSLTKSPVVECAGFSAELFGVTFASNATRVMSVAGKTYQEFGDQTVWFRSRPIQVSGFDAAASDEPSIEHGTRLVLVSGSSHESYGMPRLSYARQHVIPVAIHIEFASNHLVGNTQYIQAQGYIATEYGTRIIPETEQVFPLGFTSAFGLSAIDLYTKPIRANGFPATENRFGTAIFYNLRQHIRPDHEGDTGLINPAWSLWTDIQSRNKLVGAIGFNVGRFGYQAIDNGARQLQPVGFELHGYGAAMTAYRVRSLLVQGIDPPYIGGWASIYNDARLLAPTGFNAQAIGGQSLEKTRRYYERVGNFDSMLFGDHMVSMRVRTIAFESRYAIAPPAITLPMIDLNTRYIDMVGTDFYGSGATDLSVHFNRVTPRWSPTIGWGYPILKKLTPELPIYGHDSQAFGDTLIRLQFRPIRPDGLNMQLFGDSNTAFRDRVIPIGGFNALGYGSATKVTRLAAPPYSLQSIWLDEIEVDGDKIAGQGIGIDEPQVGEPIFNRNSIFCEGFSVLKVDAPVVSSNGIIIDSGAPIIQIGIDHHVGLKDRAVLIESGINNTIACGKPQLSPYRIYSVDEAPEQASVNHPPVDKHFVNSDKGARAAGEVFGQSIIALKHRAMTVSGIADIEMTNPQIYLLKVYLDPKGISSLRFGYHSVPTDQSIDQYDSSDTTAFGNAELTRSTYLGDITLKPSGIEEGDFGRAAVELYRRTVFAVGSDAMLFGVSAPISNPFAWQGIRIGEQVFGNYGDIYSEAFGATEISLKVREIPVVGFDAFTCEYDYTQFDKRMRVIRAQVPLPISVVTPVGFVGFSAAASNIKLLSQYIRPDGNAEQYRKGAPNA